MANGMNLSFSGGERPTGDHEMVFGHWGKVGRLEIEGFQCPPANLRGDAPRGVPFVVRDAASGAVCEEGRDYAAVPPISVRHEGAATRPYLELDCRRRARIPEGARLLVTADIPNIVSHRRTRPVRRIACPTATGNGAPELGATAVEKMLRPKKWFLCFDELRSATPAPRAAPVSLTWRI